MTPLPNQSSPQGLELLLPIERGHLKNLVEGYFSNYYWQSNIKTTDRVLTSLSSLQLFLKPGIFFLKLWPFFFKALNLSLHITKFQMMLLVCFIKLVPSSKRFIQSFGNHGILLLQGFLIIYSLIQSLRLQERSIGNILWHTRQDWSDVNNYSRKTNSSRILTLVYLKLHCI